jgi:hypothetical protein
MLVAFTSFITRDYEKIKHEFDVDIQAYNKFKNRFDVIYYAEPKDLDQIVLDNKITHLFIIKSGANDGLYSKCCKNIIHCVFDISQPPGEVYTPIGQTINNHFGKNYPVTSHIVTVPDCDETLRSALNIPENAIVFGRYGGRESFDIRFVHQDCKYITNER